MKIKVKFIGFFTLGLILFLLYLSFIVIFLLEVIFPWLGIGDNGTVFGIVFITAFISGGIIFSTWFVQPILSMLTFIGEISKGNYNQSEVLLKMKKKNGKLRMKYSLYKELIADLDSLADQLKQAQADWGKLEQAKQDWIRGISHDIKTPLSYVVGYSSLLLSLDHSWTPEEQQNFLSQIHQKGKYMESLINGMNLSFRLEDHTKPMPLQISTVDLIPFIEKLIADLVNQQVDSKYSLTLQALDTQLCIEADEQLLYRAITNLINNAIRHNPAGTNISVKIKRNVQKGVNIFVCDNGVGIPPETVGTLFLKYYDSDLALKGKRDYAGGLGLSIVKSIIEAHHGEISVDSKLDEGTTFTICLPLEQCILQQ